MLLNSLFKQNKIQLPISLKTDLEGLEFICSIYETTKTPLRHNIIDFSQVKWFEGNLCGLMGAIINHNSSFSNTFGLIGLNNSYLKTTLSNNGFLTIFDDKLSPKLKSTGIPYSKFDMQQESIVQDFIYSYVFEKHGIPDLSPGAKKKIYRSIFEIYQNAVIHSGSKFVYVCGQSYVNKKRLALTMVDIGKSIKRNVNEYKTKYSNYSGKEAIEWAVQVGNTTKTNAPGGLGFDLIRTFLRMNEGKLQIFSADGFWEEKRGVVSVFDSSVNFEGTVINIEFNLLDKNVYITDEEIDLKNIF